MGGGTSLPRDFEVRRCFGRLRMARCPSCWERALHTERGNECNNDVTRTTLFRYNSALRCRGEHAEKKDWLNGREQYCPMCPVRHPVARNGSGCQSEISKYCSP